MISRILAPVDFSDCSDRALTYAVEMTDKFQAELILLYVVPEISTLVPDAVMAVPTVGPDMDEVMKAANESLVKLVATKQLTRLNPRLESRIGSPAHTIIQTATDDKIDLIVLGTHGRSGLSHFFLGSVAEKVVRGAPCPVLTVRSTGEES